MFYLGCFITGILILGFFIFMKSRKKVGVNQLDGIEDDGKAILKDTTDLPSHYSRVVRNIIHKYDMSFAEASKLLEFKLLEIPVPIEKPERPIEEKYTVVVSNPNGNMCYSQKSMVAFHQWNEAGEFIDRLQHNRHYSNKTLSLYSNCIKQFLSWRVRHSNGDPWWSNCSQQDIVGYLDYLKEKGNAPTTIAHKMVVLNSFFKYLLAKNEIRRNPFDKVDLMNARII